MLCHEASTFAVCGLTVQPTDRIVISPRFARFFQSCSSRCAGSSYKYFRTLGRRQFRALGPS